MLTKAFKETIPSTNSSTGKKKPSIYFKRHRNNSILESLASLRSSKPMYFFC